MQACSLLSWFLVAVSAVAVSRAAKIPEAWGTCSRSDPNIDECLKGAVQRAIVDLKGGHKAWGIFATDPFKMDKVEIQQGTGNFRINLQFTDADLVGLGATTVKSVKSDLDNNQITAMLEIPTLNLNAKYAVKGQIVLIPIDGHGRSNITLERVHTELKLMGARVPGKGAKSSKEYLQIAQARVQLQPEKTTFSFVNPDNPNQQQVQLLNQFVNQNDKDVMNELGPAISEAFSQAFTDLSNRVFSRVPLDEVFPK